MTDLQAAIETVECGVLIHRGGKYVRIEGKPITRCLNCGKDIDDRDGPGFAVLLT